MGLDSNLFLTIASGLFQVLLAAMGIYVSLKPPKESRHWVWIGLFVIIGIVGVAITGVQQYKNSKAQQENENIQKELKDRLTTIQEDQKQTRNSVTKLQSLYTKKIPPAPKPEITLDILNPKLPALKVNNISKVKALKIVTSMFLYDLDSGYETSNQISTVSTPNPSWEWLPPESSQTPIEIFKEPGVFSDSDIKFGDRILGSISVNCFNCSRGNTYIVYLEYGKNGWVSRIRDETAGKIFLPANLKPSDGKPSLKKLMSLFFDELLGMAKPESRIPIKSD